MRNDYDFESKAEYSRLNIDEESAAQREQQQYQQEQQGATSWDPSYPGCRRMNTSHVGPPRDCMLLRTGGNALQAVSCEALGYSPGNPKSAAASTPPPVPAAATDLIAVSVPEGYYPGDSMLVQSPHGLGRTVAAVIPPGALPGHTFLIQIPSNDVEGPPPPFADSIPLGPAPGKAPVDDVRDAGGGTRIVVGHDIENTDLRLREVESSNSYQWKQRRQQQQEQQAPQAAPPGRGDTVAAGAVPSGATAPTGRRDGANADGVDAESDEVVLVKVPPGTEAGSKIHATTRDGRVVEATVPAEGISSGEFYVRVPPASARTSDWLGNSVYIAPVVVALAPFMPSFFFS